MRDMRYDIITIFPSFFDSFKNESLLKKAQDKKLIRINVHNLRDWTADKHKTVDDKPYGGGAGMLLKIEPLVKAIRAFCKSPAHKASATKGKKSRVILLTPSGKQFTQKKAVQFAKKYDQLIFICGRYEGFDARIKKYIDEEVSLGPYVLNGGEVAAMAIVEATARLLRGVIGNVKSLKEESYATEKNLEYPQYTRPEIFEGHKVSSVLLTGDHKKIAEWRKKHVKKSK